MELDIYIESLRNRLDECPLTRDQLAEKSAGTISASWLSKFASGHMTNPRVETLRALDRALGACEQQAA